MILCTAADNVLTEREAVVKRVCRSFDAAPSSHDEALLGQVLGDPSARTAVVLPRNDSLPVRTESWSTSATSPKYERSRS